MSICTFISEIFSLVSIFLSQRTQSSYTSYGMVLDKERIYSTTSANFKVKLQIPLIGALNLIALLVAKMPKLTRANNYNIKDYKN
jgi:hypothetical protein